MRSRGSSTAQCNHHVGPRGPPGLGERPRSTALPSRHCVRRSRHRLAAVRSHLVRTNGHTGGVPRRVDGARTRWQHHRRVVPWPPGSLEAHGRRRRPPASARGSSRIPPRREWKSRVRHQASREYIRGETPVKDVTKSKPGRPDSWGARHPFGEWGGACAGYSSRTPSRARPSRWTRSRDAVSRIRRSGRASGSSSSASTRSDARSSPRSPGSMRNRTRRAWFTSRKMTPPRVTSALTRPKSRSRLPTGPFRPWGGSPPPLHATLPP